MTTKYPIEDICKIQHLSIEDAKRVLKEHDIQIILMKSKNYVLYHGYEIGDCIKIADKRFEIRINEDYQYIKNYEDLVDDKTHLFDVKYFIVNDMHFHNVGFAIRVSQGPEPYADFGVEDGNITLNIKAMHDVHLSRPKLKRVLELADLLQGFLNNRTKAQRLQEEKKVKIPGIDI